MEQQNIQEENVESKKLGKFTKNRNEREIAHFLLREGYTIVRYYKAEALLKT